ncbi:unnamed protein product [Ilex paraguariensis]|uniref:Uncharacterized protein n=1 Tax=Ilex paraguariensis TaxID=185542 RepID=A0ABC8RJR7_9AQUA
MGDGSPMVATLRRWVAGGSRWERVYMRRERLDSVLSGFRLSLICLNVVEISKDTRRWSLTLKMQEYVQMFGYICQRLCSDSLPDRYSP